MNDEPKAGMNLDPEMLAAYIDNRLSPEQRAEVEAQLARDPDSYAVLVETMKALDDLAQPARVDPVRSRQTSRRWLVIAGTLAAAGLALIIQQSVWPNRPETPVSRLVAAVGNTRELEPRLSGGFPYARLEETTRGPELPSQNLALLAAAGEIQKQVQSNPTPETERAWGIAQLLVGRPDGAVKSLRSALESGGSNDAAAYSDVAAAYLALARSGQKDQLPRALEFASQALARNPRLPEASFNRALALEALSLSAEALEEWRRYLTIEPDAQWRDEAQRHIQVLEERLKPLSRLAVPSNLTALANLGEDEIGRLFVESTSALRLALEGPVLLEAMRGPADQTSPAIAKAVALADRLQAETGDGLTAATWRHALNSDRRAQLSRGLEAYQAGANFVTANDLTAAEAQFKAANALLLETGSPIAAWTTFFLSHCDFYLGRTAEAFARLQAESGRQLASARYAVAARSFYLIGLVHLRLGQQAAMASVEQQAATIAKRAGDAALEASAHSEVADALERLALLPESWQERLEVLRLSETLGDFALRHIATVSASRAASATGDVLASQAFANATLRNADRWNHVAAQAEARIRLADAAQRANDAERALQLLDEADQYLLRMPDSAFADGWRADLEMARATALLSISPDKAHAASVRAFEILERRQSPFRLARAKWLSGKSLAGNDPEGARDEFRAGLHAASVGVSGPDPFGRSLADQRWALLREVVGLLPATSRPDDGLDDVLSTLLGGRQPPTAAGIRSALAPADLAAVMLSLDDKLVIWSVTASAVEKTLVPIKRIELMRLVEEYSIAIEDPSSENWEAAGARLAALLLPPVVAAHPRRLFLIPDAVLSSVAFAALPWPGSDRSLAELTEVETLAWYGPRRLARRQRPTMLAIGDPENGTIGRSLPSLTGAREEAQQVGALYAGARVLLGPIATRTEFLSAAQAADVIHFAGHALASRTDPAASRLLLAGDRGDSELTAGQIATLSLRAELVVLGACEGASSSAAGNQPIFGLARAFLQAGVSDVIAAQWKMSDAASRDFLVELHREFSRGSTPSAALRSARNSLRADSRYSHPYYWAGFNVYTAKIRASGEPS